MRKSLVLELSGGLGNQLFQYYFYLYLLNQSVCADLNLLFSGYWFNVANRQSHEVLLLHKISSEIIYAKLSPPLLFFLRRRSVRPILPALSFLTSFIFDFKIVTETSIVSNEALDFLLHSFYRSSPDTVFLRGHWQKLFPFIYNASLVNKIRDSIYTHRSPLYLERDVHQNSVCVHVRRGDYLTNRHLGSLTHNALPETYYRHSVSLFLDILVNPSFVVFSDDIDWCMSSGLFPSSSVEYISRNQFSDDFECFLFMTQFSHYILANSTYGFWAALLSGSLCNLIFPASYSLCSVFSPSVSGRIANIYPIEA